MDIDVLPINNGWVATANDNGTSIYVSTKHPRPGCAVREVLNWLHTRWGTPVRSVQLQLKEWR